MATLPAYRDVFLSHRSVNKTFVRRLAADIESQFHKGKQLLTWLDEAEIRAGQSIVGMVNLGLDSSRFVALVMTPEYFNSQSGWTDVEWHAALFDDPDNRRGRILPILAADCPYIPPLLRHLKVIDFRDKKYAAGLSELLDVLREQPLRRAVPYRGQLIEPSGRISRETLVAERAVPDSDPDVSHETLYANLLPIERLPKLVYVGKIAESVRKKNVDGSLSLPTKSEAISLVRAKLESEGKAVFTPAFRFRGDELWTFHDLEDPECPLSVLIDNEQVEVEKVPTTECLADDKDRGIVIALLNMALMRHLGRRGLILDKDKHGRVFFPPRDGQPHKIKWRPTRQRVVERTVAKPFLKNGEQIGWIHPAAYMQVIYLASHLFIKIIPTRVLTFDGINAKAGPDVGRIVVRWLGKERNIHVLYNVRFWTMILRSNRGPTISIYAGDQVIEVDPKPASIEQSFGIGSDRMNLMDRLAEEAEFIAHEEDAAEFEVQTAHDDAEDDVPDLDSMEDEDE